MSLAEGSRVPKISELGVPMACACDERMAYDFEADAWGTGNPRKVSRDSTRIGSLSKLVLPQHEGPCGDRFRKRELEDRKAQYLWDFTFNDGRTFPIPTGLPACEVTGVQHVLDAVSHTFQMSLTASFTAVKEKLRAFGQRQNKIEFTKSLYAADRLPKVMENDRWKTDEEFGRQRLQGLYPKMVRKLDITKREEYNALLAKFPVNQCFANYASLIRGVKSFEDAVRSGRLYYIDYHLLDGIDAPPERFLTAPIALFYDDKEESKFMPLAIQLGQDPTKFCIFTSRTQNANGDAGNVWLAAKIHFQVAEVQYHGVLGHLLHTHWAMESLYTAMRRNLSSHHPLHELLYPHFWFTVVIEFAARHFLIAESNPLPNLLAMGFVGQNNIMAKGWKDFKFRTQMNINADVEERGAQDIKNYYFYEDGSKIWTAIHRYVKSMVHNFYPDHHDPETPNDSIAKDHELQGWYTELSSASVCGFRDLPEIWNADAAKFRETRDNLVEFITCTIFNVSAGHAAVNNTQWEYLGCPVNMPGTYWMPPPTKPDQVISDSEIANAFPGLKDTILQLGMFRGLTTATYRPLGWFNQGFFAGRTEMAPIVGRFRKELDEIADEIEKANNDRERRPYPYPYLNPRQIAMGIAI